MGISELKRLASNKTKSTFPVCDTSNISVDLMVYTLAAILAAFESYTSADFSFNCFQLSQFNSIQLLSVLIGKLTIQLPTGFKFKSEISHTWRVSFPIYQHDIDTFIKVNIFPFTITISSADYLEHIFHVLLSDCSTVLGATFSDYIQIDIPTAYRD